MFPSLLKLLTQLTKVTPFAAAVVLLCSLVVLVPGQRKLTSMGEEAPAFHDYRGIQLGMTTDEVRKKLGDPKDKGDEQDFFVFKDSETAQILYDKSHKVITISADFMGKATDIPTARQVFGSDIEAKADGSMYKMIRYPKAGYWLSYNRTAGDSPLTTVTLQKIDQ